MAKSSPSIWNHFFPIVMLCIAIWNLPSDHLLTNCIIFIQFSLKLNFSKKKSHEGCIAYNKLGILYCNWNCIVIDGEGRSVLSYAPWQTFLKDCLNKQYGNQMSFGKSIWMTKNLLSGYFFSSFFFLWRNFIKTWEILWIYIIFSSCEIEQTAVATYGDLTEMAFTSLSLSNRTISQAKDIYEPQGDNGPQCMLRGPLHLWKQ